MKQRKSEINWKLVVRVACLMLLDVMLLPLLALGAVAGVALVKRMPEHGYRKMIVVLTVLSTAMLLI